MRHFGMAIGARELEDGIAVPVDAQPLQSGEDRVDRRLRRAGTIGILDPQQERAAMVTRVQPIEQRGARAAEVQIAGGRGANRVTIPAPSPERFSTVAPNRACSQSLKPDGQFSRRGL